jgi:hypothetical protein
MLKIAMQNSIIESMGASAELKDIEQMPVFRPTEAEFAEPMIYIDKLMKEQDIKKFGCIKIVPPASYKPPLAFDLNSEERLPTRF